MGNHEEMMLRVVANREAPHSWLRYGGAATLDSYQFCGNLNVVPADHVAGNGVYMVPGQLSADLHRCGDS